MPPVFNHKTTTFKRLWPLFGLWQDEKIDVGAHLIRLIVLYEDLRIEFHACYADHLEELDQNDVIYRRLYFVRRIYATLVEIAGAIHQLNCSKEFRAQILKTSKERLKHWREAVKFFAAKHEVIHNRRNLYGGHFSDDAATYARRNLDYATTGMVTIAQDPHHGVSRALYRFALEFVGLAITADKENKDLQAFVHEGFEFMKEAMRHATQAIAAVGDSQILPYFGVKSE